MVMNISRRGLAGFAASATAAGFLIPSAEADTLDETLKNNVLRVGINPNSPPFSARDASRAPQRARTSLSIQALGRLVPVS